MSPQSATEGPLTVIFYGRAGSGKGTQLALLKAKLEETAAPLLVVETGAAFRTFITNDSYTSGLAKSRLDAGKLPEVFIPIWLWAGVLINSFTGKEHLLFDGFPRRVVEAEVLDSAFSLYERGLVHIVALTISPEKTRERLKLRKRDDDMSEEQIRERNAWYENDVVPTIDYFKKHPERYRVHEINGDQSVADVHRDVLTSIGLA